MTTRIAKDMRNNWAAHDEFDLGGDRLLTIRTSKVYSGNLVTSATVGVKLKEGLLVSHSPFNDYHRRLHVGTPTRATSKVVAAQHDQALCLLEEVKSEITEFYIAKDRIAAFNA